MRGVMLGIAEDPTGKPHVAISMIGERPLVLTLEYAAALFEQLGLILEESGFFEKSAPPRNANPSKKGGSVH